MGSFEREFSSLFISAISAVKGQVAFLVLLLQSFLLLIAVQLTLGCNLMNVASFFRLSWWQFPSPCKNAKMASPKYVHGNFDRTGHGLS